MCGVESERVKIIIKRHNINYNVYIMVLIGEGVRNVVSNFWLNLVQFLGKFEYFMIL